MTILTAVQIDCATGLEGDRFDGRLDSSRQVTLIQQEHLAVIAAGIGRAIIEPALLRRDIVVSGINLPALQDKRLHIDDALLEFSESCYPGNKMERVLGVGGIAASVIEAGRLRIGDRLFYTSA